MAVLADTTSDRAELWASVDALADRLAEESLDDRGIRSLRQHRMGLLVAERLRARGAEVPAALAADEQRSVLVALAIPALLQRARAAVEGPLMVMKGPEVAALYPDDLHRPCVDLDLLAGDPHAAHRELLAAGFVRVEEFDWPDSHHHLPPLQWPGLPVAIEIHLRPNWIDGLRPPSVEALLAAGVPSRLGIPGLLAPAPEHHVLLVAAHAWAHRPLGRLGDLVDVEALALEADPERVAAAAREWRCRRMWQATRRAASDVLGGHRRSLALRTWARHLPAGRDRTVLAAHAQRWVAPLWATPPHQAPLVAASAIARDLAPYGGESWSAKAGRVRMALANGRGQETDHLERVALKRAKHDFRGVRSPGQEAGAPVTR